MKVFSSQAPILWKNIFFHPPLEFPTHFCQNNLFKVSCQTCMQMRNTLSQSSSGQTLRPAEQTCPDRTSYTWQEALVSHSILVKNFTLLIHIKYCVRVTASSLVLDMYKKCTTIKKVKKSCNLVEWWFNMEHWCCVLYSLKMVLYHSLVLFYVSYLLFVFLAFSLHFLLMDRGSWS